MDKEQFLNLFTECIKNEDIQIVATIKSSECLGDTVTTQIWIEDKKIIEKEFDFELIKNRY